MHYFTPDLHLPGDEPESRQLTDKFGGRPEGFPYQLWPVCAQCGCYQSFGAQFTHDPERLDLGRPGRRLFLFQCAEPESVGVCETWEADSGANAAIVVEPEGLIMGLTHLPVEGIALEQEVLVGDWKRHDDGIEPADAAAYFSDDGRGNLTDEEFEKTESVTKLGSVPTWVQGAEEVDHTKWQFVGQLTSFHSLQVAGEPNYIDAANYGGGLAYFFIERHRNGDTPQALVFWQC